MYAGDETYPDDVTSGGLVEIQGRDPMIDEIIQMEEEGYVYATDGCECDPDGYCEHGKPSWLLVYGLI